MKKRADCDRKIREILRRVKLVKCRYNHEETFSLAKILATRGSIRAKFGSSNYFARFNDIGSLWSGKSPWTLRTGAELRTEPKQFYIGNDGRFDGETRVVILE